ncbi:CaiB/BaiF CoA-transferase family protein [Puniceibacterium sp. IMCC21224]|uniref:CaiB/BaiF CoA transferase family protein n=1 Tax=Puniceibacterium sp. IMCC21224 TaxID=1618204 RepID=UPI00064DB779|nr:CoA transferase [Puniceibacterium sp. IMCC21224]KMK64930.1 putative acyl-CoA transferase/carnitine dehydratase [Puniceibacterium sp. IMCC21224]
MKPDFLKDIRFTDLTWAGAGPFGTKVFSDFGADIIKVESTVRIDPVRAGGPFRDREAGVNRSGYFASRNTGKKSFTVDPKTEEGRAIVFDLVRRSDVVTNNFGAGAMDRLGLSYKTLREIKDDIIYLSMPMYGESGPLANTLGLGMTISGVTGLMWATAYEQGDPIGPGTHYPDHAANPYHAAFAVLAALRYRKATGKGTKIDLSQVESTINFIGQGVTDWAISGKEPEVTGNADARFAPHNVYRSAGDDDWVAIAVTSDDQWLGLCRGMGRDDLAAEPGLATSADRVAARARLDQIVSGWTLTRSPDAAAEELRQAGVPAARVASSRYLIEDDAQLAARGYFQRVAHPELGNSLYASLPFTIDGARIALDRPPLLGEHTKQIMRDLLDMPQAEIDRLDAQGVLK